MRHALIAATVTVATLGLAAAAGATSQFTCNNGGRVFNITPGSSPIDVTVMWTKAGTDCDIIVDDGAGTIVALGIGIESRYETVTFGPLPGIPVRITALKASGPNSKAYLRGSDQAQFIGRGHRATRLRYAGTAEELEARDPDYARVLETVRRYQRLKAPAEAERE